MNRFTSPLVNRLLCIYFLMSNYMNVLHNGVCHSNKMQLECGLFSGEMGCCRSPGDAVPFVPAGGGAILNLNKATVRRDKAQVGFHPRFLSWELRRIFILFFSVRMSTELTDKKILLPQHQYERVKCSSKWIERRITNFIC